MPRKTVLPENTSEYVKTCGMWGAWRRALFSASVDPAVCTISERLGTPPMAYSDFSLTTVRSSFGLQLSEACNLFAAVEPVSPSAEFATRFEDRYRLATAINTEKARSEFLIAPTLFEARFLAQARFHHLPALFSGSEFTVDRDRGLQGFCDYLMTASPEQFFIDAPLVAVVEAKNENLKNALGQCLAEMVAAQIFNQRAGIELPQIYGAVTSGTAWRFLTLAGETVAIDAVEYYIKEINKILGILLQPFASFWANDPSLKGVLGGNGNPAQT